MHYSPLSLWHHTMRVPPAACARGMQAKKLSPDEVAQVVYAAIQKATYYDEHFYVRDAGATLAVGGLVRALGHALGINFAARIIDRHTGVR